MIKQDKGMNPGRRCRAQDQTARDGNTATEVRYGNPIAYLFLFGIIVIIGVYLIWPKPAKQAELNAAQTTELRSALESINARDQMIAEKEHLIIQLEKVSNPAKDQIEQYHQLLWHIQWARKERAESAMSYNNKTARLFKHRGIPPSAFAKVRLPAGIK